MRDWGSHRCDRIGGPLTTQATLVLTLAAVMAVQCGCDPQQRISLNTVDEMGRPVPRVRVELYCPSEKPWQREGLYDLGIRDASGSLIRDEAGATPTHCVVRAAERKSSGVKVAEICEKRRALLSSCLSFVARVVVAR